MAMQKCKNILLQAALKDFWSSAKPKLKKLSLPKLSLLQDHTEENKWFKILLHMSFQKVFKSLKSLKVFKGLQTYERYGSHLMVS